MASGAEPLTEALAQALARDGPRSSRHAPESEAPGYPIENMGRYPHADASVLAALAALYIAGSCCSSQR